MLWSPFVAAGEFTELPTLVQTLASGGVYTLAIIYTIYMWQRATDDVRRATPNTRQHFVRVQNVVVAFSLLLGILATGVWFYSTFLRNVEYFTRGTVKGVAQKAAPIPIASSNGAIYNNVSIEPPNSEVSSYSHENSSVIGGYELQWALASRDPIKNVIVHIVQAYAKPDERPTADGTPHTIEVLDRKRATLDLSKYDGVRPVDIRYEPDVQHPDKVASVFVDWGSGRQALQLADDTVIASRDITPPLEWTLIPTLHAAQNAAVELRFDKRTSGLLRQQLGGADIPSQQSAERLLITQGAKSFPFIEDSLKTTDVPGSDRAVLVRNLADAVTQISRRGATPPPSLQVTFARTFYDLGDYAEALRRYTDNRVVAIMGPDDYSKRAYCNLRLGKQSAALDDYNHVLAIASARDNGRTAMAHYGIGMVDLEMGQRDEAVREFRKAARIDNSAVMALNNQAMTWATLGEKLDFALIAATEAVNASDNAPAILDTKGFVLFKLKRYDEAVIWLTRAAQGAPMDDEIQQHLAQARAAAHKS